MENEWKSYSLGEICSYSKERINIEDVTNKNYISTENMFPDKGGITKAATLPNVKSVSRYEKGDTLISNIRPYFKKIWFSDKRGGASNDVLVIKGKSEKVFNKYLYYFLTQDKFFDYVMGTSKGTKMPRGDKDAILKYDIKLPPLDEQKAIAKVLSDLDEKIEINNKINKKLEEMAKAIFKQWFVDFEFPNEDGKPYKSSGGEMVESELGVIPKGWEDSNVLDNVEQVKNKNKKKLDLPVLTVVKEGKFICSEDYFTKQVYSKDTSNYKIVEKYDVGYNPSRANIGSIAMLKEFDKGLLSPMYVVFRLNKKIMPFYFEYYMKRPGFIDKIALNSSGTTRQNFDYKAFRDFKIIIPPIEVQEKAYKLIKNLQDNIKNRNLENSNLMKIRDLLLPKLMSGEIRVPLNNEEN